MIPMMIDGKRYKLSATLLFLKLLMINSINAAKLPSRGSSLLGFTSPLKYSYGSSRGAVRSNRLLKPVDLQDLSLYSICERPKPVLLESLVKRTAIPTTTIQDVGGAILVALASGLWLKIWTYLATSQKVDSKDSHPSARFFAAGVPLLQAIAVTLSGLSKSKPAGSKEEKKPGGLVAAISRSGNPAEVLRGPLIYVLVLLLSTVLYWRDNVVGIVAVSQMAAGDGMADIVGRRWGKVKWPFSQTKSYVGTAAFALSGFVVSLGLMAWFNYWHLLPHFVFSYQLLGRVALISLLASVVELIPLGDDNVTVPVVSSLLAMLLLQ